MCQQQQLRKRDHWRALQNADGSFQTAVSYPSGGYYAYSLGVSDVNGDGKPDLELPTNARPIAVAPMALSACCWVMATVPSSPRLLSVRAGSSRFRWP